MMTTAILSSKGQIVIPKQVRDKLNLGTGDRVEFVEDPEGGFRIVPASGDIRELRGIIAKPKTLVSIEQMKKAIAAHAARRSGAKR